MYENKTADELREIALSATSWGAARRAIDELAARLIDAEKTIAELRGGHCPGCDAPGCGGA